MTTRRNLFALAAGALAAPYLPKLPAAAPARGVLHQMTFAEPSRYVRYSGYEVMTLDWDKVTLGGIDRTAQSWWRKT